MDILKLTSECSSKFETWYDVAAFCYDRLTSIIEDQELFIGRYILSNESADNNNPNLDMMIKYELRSNEIIRKYSMDVEQGIDEILQLISSTKDKLNSYGEPDLNQATLLYFLLTAIDRFSGSVRNSRHAPAPLNCGFREKSYVYFASPENLIHDAATELEFGSVITDTEIKHCLTNLCIVDSCDCMGTEAPKVVTISFNITSERPTILHTDRSNGKKPILKIALIPFWGKKVTDFHVTLGVNFEVRYSKEYLKFAIKRALELLEIAIDQEANIIVFPEYLCAPAIQAEIGMHLENIYRKEPQRLQETLLVIAGSGWSDDSNNVMQIFDRTGANVGSYYKYSKFQNKKHLEGLAKPGKECTLIDIPGVGRILPAICRDVSNEEYTRCLVDNFNPFLLLTSAWSPSVNRGFKNQFDALIKRYQVIPMLCNCCEALLPSSEKSAVRKTVNLVATPYKKGSICFSKFVKLQRNKNCFRICERCKCMFIVYADFSIEQVRTQNIICAELKNVKS